jgi:uncharacterized protein (TIGR03067 family)
MLTRSLFLTVAAVSLGFAPAPIWKERLQPDTERVRSQLEGVWIIESYAFGGRVQGGPGQTWEKVVIKGGTWSQICRVNGRENGTTPYVIALDAKDPTRLDMAYEGAKVPLLYGVFRLDGDRLVVTHATSGPRPTSHTDELRTGQDRYVLRRSRP